ACRHRLHAGRSCPSGRAGVGRALDSDEAVPAGRLVFGPWRECPGDHAAWRHSATNSGGRSSGVTPIGVFSARADGATSVAIGLAAVLAAGARTLLIDLNLDNPEVATILDLDPEVGIFDLAYKAQLAPVDRDELDQHTGFRDRIAVLPGVNRRDDVGRITPHFLAGLLDAASRRFEHVVIDLGRLPSSLASAAEGM